ncbi:MAG: alpha/beta hydrolase [Gammaproteobacteria bacterium]|nr:alpha/beta hydrolase [Gammaproteobacteria bacterium]
MPVGILWEEQDGWVDIGEGRRLQAPIPAAEFRVLPDAEHFSMVDRPCLCARELAELHAV